MLIESFCRFAKRKLDEFVFYGNRLQVSYAPQFESLSDTKEKLEDRRKEVQRRIRCGFIFNSVIETPVTICSQWRFIHIVCFSCGI